MADYYGKLKDSEDKNKGKVFKRTILIVLVVMIIVVLIASLAGIFGDTKRRDETREIIVENAELKQQIFELTEENEALLKENEELKKTLSEYSLEVGTTLTKPEGDLSENLLENSEEESEN